MSNQYFAEQKVVAWAIPKLYRLEGEPEFEIRVALGDHKPYQDGAFSVSARDLKWEVVVPENHAELQIASLEETREEEYKSHARRLLDLTDQISNLRALPAPK